MNQAFWRKWHRWIGFPAALFLLFASVTGFILACTEFFGADEALREHNRTLVSPVTLQSPAAQWAEPLAKAFATAAAQSGGAPVDNVTMVFKGDQPTVTIYTGKPSGGEDRKFVFDAKTGALLHTKAYTDKPFLLRLHSGEEEALRERLRDTVSKVSLQMPNADFAAQFARAQEAVAAKTGGQPLDKIVWQLKGDAPAVSFYLLADIAATIERGYVSCGRSRKTSSAPAINKAAL